MYWRATRSYAQWKGFTASSFDFDPNGPPHWLAAPPNASSPLVLRIAILSAADEPEIRAFLRDNVYNRAQIPREEVQFELKFFVGRQRAERGRIGLGHDAALEVDRRVHDELARYGDIELMDVEEGRWAMAQKRFAALQWAASVPQSEYDFFFTADSDSFVRLVALARRMRFLRPNLLDPRNTPTMWGDMLPKRRHWRKSQVPGEPDEEYTGEWYQFPNGIGYLMSSSLAATLNNVSDLLPHNVPYYADDIIVGSWVAEHAPETIIISDRGGFHDPPLHGKHPLPIEYSTVLIHHLNLEEMQQLRALPEFQGEWLQQLPAAGTEAPIIAQ
ncbi:hypothetical protein AURDEDRAFT_156396 [Auricularia subglabra TFB-10046 SS5]|nr:hypothetical protein AURDEDRAFT_156396 [Auricularia subglabra TFB-10046 SS5]